MSAFAHLLWRGTSLTGLLLATGALCAAANSATPDAPNQQDVRIQAELTALSTFEPIDAHTHVGNSDALFTQMLRRWHLHLLDILVDNDKDPQRLPLDRQRKEALEFVGQSRGHATLCTTFDPFMFSKPDFAGKAITGLRNDFDQGAVAVKIWKNIGMELQDAKGRYVLPDDAAFEPIYREIAARNKTLIAHQAEPDVAWGPADPKAIDASYYAEHPEWNMQNVKGAPSKDALLAARDHMLAMNPNLRVVGAHLGSMESDVALVAQRLDRYPNFAVDTAARIPHLTIQPSEKVRHFLIKYQNRVLYGTDLEFSKHDDARQAIAEWQKQYAQDWRYLATADRFEYDGRKVQGLHLPRAVLRKLFHDNAVQWIPGVYSSAVN